MLTDFSAGSSRKNLGVLYTPKLLRISSLLIILEASQFPTGNHSYYQSSCYCHVLCTKVLHGFQGIPIALVPAHLIPIPTLSPQSYPRCKSFDVRDLSQYNTTENHYVD